MMNFYVSNRVETNKQCCELSQNTLRNVAILIAVGANYGITALFNEVTSTKIKPSQLSQAQNYTTYANAPFVKFTKRFEVTAELTSIESQAKYPNTKGKYKHYIFDLKGRLKDFNQENSPEINLHVNMISYQQDILPTSVNTNTQVVVEGYFDNQIFRASQIKTKI